ncbi:M50 family metallopeptidase [Thalassoglobus polymorphus]|uniref:ATP-dependent zinc metalloprotease FtsH n=1 Tax=Thalassoglobus polymorphus TaxID=2527994 RepID=A0A517QTP9_9PLAN|nr:M50 family metallopeptidase [Thalassoglobus polymorphus]QDT35025.1 ATP-dependent zinc metalloprotease FtsH [Thalassoglobus polymorphus]
MTRKKRKPIPPSDPVHTDSVHTGPSAKLKATAFHEAGHAVMAMLLGRPVEKVTIAPGQMQSGLSRLGACKMQKGMRKPSRDPLEDEVLILLSGMVAESRVTGRYCQLGASQDLHLVKSLLSENRATNERQLQRLARRMIDKTENLLSRAEPTQAIELIANELLKNETISGRAVRHLFEISKQSHS